MSKDGTEKLLENLICQQDRLLQQLGDLEEVKDELDADEYKDTRQETLDQIIDVAAALEKLTKGNISLSDSQQTQRQAILQAIRTAFHTPEVIRMFAKREPDLLRQRLAEKTRDFKLGKLTVDIFTQDKKELLLALRGLGESLTVEEEKELSAGGDHQKSFVPVSEATDEIAALRIARSGR